MLEDTTQALSQCRWTDTAVGEMKPKAFGGLGLGSAASATFQPISVLPGEIWDAEH